MDMRGFRDKDFCILMAGENLLSLESKSTHHFWKIIFVDDYTLLRPVLLFHRYAQKAKYHFQGDFSDLSDAIKAIKNHDEYFLNKNN